MDEALQPKFEEKLKTLIEGVKVKENVVEYSEVQDTFAEFNLDEEQFEKVLEALDASGIDVLRIDPNVEDEAFVDLEIEGMDIDIIDEEKMLGNIT